MTESRPGTPVSAGNPDLAPLDQFRRWLIADALPRWSSVGFDQSFEGFHERLSLSGEPIRDVPYRLVTQARQIYVFSHGALLGWSPKGRELAQIALENLRRRYRSPDGQPGYAFAITPTLGKIDGRRDFYGHAFLLYALAWWYRVSADGRVVDEAFELLKTVDQLFAASSFGGFVDGRPSTAGRRIQNPHMHFFEAMLAWHAATGDARFLARAGEIFSLFTSRFWQPATQTLSEYFDDSWAPAAGDTGMVFEPGHHFEWGWLLRAYSRASGRPVDAYVRPLYEKALSDGSLSDGRIVDEVLPGRGPSKRSTRLWPHTELAKAAVAEHENGDGDAAFHAMRALGLLQRVFCRPDLNGGWIDHVDFEQRPMGDFMPATSLYHIFLAVAEVSRVFKP